MAKTLDFFGLGAKFCTHSRVSKSAAWRGGRLKGKCIDFSSRAQMKDNWISVPMVYLSLAYGKGNLPYRRFPDPVSMATTGDDAHSA